VYKNQFTPIPSASSIKKFAKIAGCSFCWYTEIQSQRQDSDPMTHLSLAFLGAYEVQLDGAPVTGFESDKVRALLAYLAVEARPQRRAALTGLLWPEMPEASARHNLSQVLFNLRQVIDDRHVHPPFLLISRETIQFNPASGATVDVATFTRLLADCDAHDHDRPDRCDQCAPHLQQAVDLYRGDFLHHFFLEDSAAFEEWTLVQREQLHRRALTALATLAAYYEHHANAASAVRAYERQLQLDPWREAAHQGLMRVWAGQGERSAALAQYEICRRVLADELAVEPSAETQALYEQIRTGDLQFALSDVQDQPLPSESVHRKSDIIHRLPTYLTPFLGRKRELAEVSRLLAAPECRLLTLVGPGGMGKTRLAVQVANQVRTRFLHGVAFVSLAALTAGEQIGPAVAEAVGLRFDGPLDPQRQLINHLRNKTLLLVLDNVEHLLADAQSVGCVRALLHETAGVKLLVTSREPLDIQSEWVFEIEGLGSSAADLFLQSARRVRAGFTWSPADQPQIDRICQLVGEMPLGIELAASWVRLLTLAEIAGEIERNLDFLTTSARDVPPRHRSMRVVFDHSWQLLTEEERHGLKRLALFRGGFRREAAEQVAAVSLSLLSTLVAKSLLHRTQAGRYDLHELIRQYAGAHLHQDTAEAAQTRDRHGHYFAAWLQREDHAIRGAIQPDGAAAIRAEIDNIRLAWQWAIAQRAVSQIQALIFTLFWFYDFSSRYREGVELFHQASESLAPLVESGTEPSADLQATFGHLLAFEAWFNMRFGQLIQAKTLVARSITCLRPLPAPVALSDALRCQGFLFHLTGDVYPARQSLAESLAIKQRVGDDWEPSFQLVHRGMLAYAQGDYHESCRLLREALAIVRRLGYTHAIARALMRLSLSVLATGVDDPQAYGEARQLAEESLHLSLPNQDLAASAHAYNLLGIIRQHQPEGLLAESADWFRKALALYRQIGDWWSVAHVLNNLGETLRRLGDRAAATAAFAEAAALAHSVQVEPTLLDALTGLATLALENGDADQAWHLAMAVEGHPQSSTQARQRGRQICQALAHSMPPPSPEAINPQTLDQLIPQLVDAVL
jgi:predicted ATPase/DNA-binding SARP family transcriptional activator